VVILAAALFARRPGAFRTLRWEWGLCALLLLLITSPSFGNCRFSYRWLPFFFLVLAVLAGTVLGQLRAGNPAPPNLGRWCFFLVVVVWVRALMLALVPMLALSVLGIGFVAVSFLWLWVEQNWAADSLPRRAMPGVVVLATCWLTYATCVPYCEIATWEIGEQVRRPEPLDPTIRYMSLFTHDDIWDENPDRLVMPSRGIGAELYLGNTAMYSGLELVPGYSSMGPAGLEQVLPFRMQGYAPAEGIERLLKVETRPDGLLELLGVDGLVVAERFSEFRPRLIANGWREVGRVQGGRVFHRDGPRSPRIRVVEQTKVSPDRGDVCQRIVGRQDGAVPLILLGSPDASDSQGKHFAPAELTGARETRNGVTVDVAAAGEGESLVVFARPWFPGYQATWNGQPVAVEVADLILPAVRVPAGSPGRLVLEYRPRSLVIGAWLAAVTAAVTIGAVVLAAARRLRYAPANRAECPSPFVAAGERALQNTGGVP
jgi:hypothetical protein